MGSIQSYLTSPTALLLVAVVGAASYATSKHTLQPPLDSTSPSAIESATKQSNNVPGSTNTTTASSGSKKNKKKKQQNAVTSDAPSSFGAQANVVSFPPIIPGGFEPTTPTAPETPAESATKSKKKKKAKKASTPAGGAGARITPPEPQSDSSATAPESHTKPQKKKSPAPKPLAQSSLLENEGPWTRVESRKRTAPEGSASSSAPARPESDAGITSITGTSSSVADEAEAETSHVEENRRTLAEKLLPKARKTGVEDMLETPDVPTIGRVMRVAPRPDERPAAGFSWGDYEDVDESRLTADDADGEDDEGGWVVKSSRPKTKPQSTGSQTSQPSSAPETLTKKQRQNAAKREAQKAAKADAEAERQAALAKHKRDLEKVKIAEQLNSSKGKKSGGMSSYVNEKGQLVWD